MTTGHVKANSGMTDQETWARQWVAVTLALKTAETKYATTHANQPQSHRLCCRDNRLTNEISRNKVLDSGTCRRNARKTRKLPRRLCEAT
jgi:hypothetical protein